MSLSQPTSSELLDEQKSAEVDLAWGMGCASLAANNNQILINAQVYHLIGRPGIEELKLRLSRALGDIPVAACIDTHTQLIRLMPAPAVSPEDSIEKFLTINVPESQGSAAKTSDGQNVRVLGQKSKIPRPPNAFILYRQHHHPIIKAHNPSLHNNEISKMLGRRWKDETDVTKLKYKKLSEELKSRHAAKYPGYQYAPRRPGEKKKRMTARKLQQHRAAQADQVISDFSNIACGSNTSKLAEESTNDDNIHESSNWDDQPWERDLPETSSVLNLFPDFQTLQYHDDGTVGLHVPSSNRNLQQIIEEDLEQYQRVIKDMNGKKPEPTTTLYSMHLSGLLDEAAGDQVNYLESLVDWDGLGAAMANVQEMADDLEQRSAYQKTSPTVSRQ